MTARSIYTGGITSIAGAITSIHPLDQTISIREFGTGRGFEVRVPGSRLYRALPPYLNAKEPQSPSSALVTRHQLVAVGFVDVESGDWVLLTGLPGRGPGSMACFALVTRLGYLDFDAEPAPLL
jgi:hypothetical protein